MKTRTLIELAICIPAILFTLTLIEQSKPTKDKVTFTFQQEIQHQQKLCDDPETRKLLNETAHPCPKEITF